MLRDDDIEKQVNYWRTTAATDLACAEVLIGAGGRLQGLFFAHLALEKLLKAHITRATHEVPPRLHSLTRLAALSGLALSEEQLTQLDALNRYCIAGRYPDDMDEEVTHTDALTRFKSARELYTWLNARL